MKRLIATLVATLCVAAAFAQDDPLVEAYKRNFVRASLPGKLELLIEAAEYRDKDMGPLYALSLQFALDNAALIKTDSVLRDLVVFTVKAIGQAKYAAAAPNLVRLFDAYKDTGIRMAILDALALVGNATVIGELNDILSTFNANHRAGLEPDHLVLASLVTALGTLGDGSSFGILFSTLVAGYPDAIRSRASEALGALKGDYRAFIVRVIETNPPAEKAAALGLARESPKLSDEDKGFVAESALRIALGFSSPNQADQAAMRIMRYAAVNELERTKRAQATTLVVKHFRETIADYARGSAPKSALVEAMACLGAMGTNEAAQALALYLEAYNAETERGRAPDEQIALALVNALARLGDPIAYDDILYMSYLSYPENVKKAAREALSRLR